MGKFPEFKVLDDQGEWFDYEERKMFDPGIEGCGRVSMKCGTMILVRHIVRFVPLAVWESKNGTEKSDNACPKCGDELGVRKQETQRGDAFYPFCEGCGYRGVRIKKEDVADPDSCLLIEE